MSDSHRPFDELPPAADPSPHLRARVPDQVAGGAFSTGAIVVTGPTEFIIDFVQTIGRPHRVTARVIIPHPVMPQFIDALGKNLAIFTDRFGPPAAPLGIVGPAAAASATAQPQMLPKMADGPQATAGAAGKQEASPTGSPASGHGAGPTPSVPPEDSLKSAFGSTDVFPGSPSPAQPATPHSGAGDPAAGQGRRPTPQEIYDDLKIPDAILSGAYANGVMIGHGSSEFCLDFLTSFYPQSAVSSRVFMAASQVPRLLESLQHAHRQLIHVRQHPPRPPKSPDDGPRPADDDN